MTKPAAPYFKDGFELDQIAVRGIRQTGHHGVFDREREAGQLFTADVVVHLSTRSAAAGDDLHKTVNYSDVADRAAEVLAGNAAQLIETLAEHIALSVLEMHGVECVDVTVHKPQAPLHVEFADVSVSVRRDLKSGGLWSDKRIGSSAGMPDDPLAPGAIAPARDVLDEASGLERTAVIALGGNLGDVKATFEEVLRELDRIPGIRVVATSPLVKSVAVGGPADQPDYLNAVAVINTTVAPRELLHAIHGLEIVHGRERTVVNGPRTLDLDIIDFAGIQTESADLTLPHPRAHERNFVILPWAAIAPEAVLPGHGPIGEVARGLGLEGLTVIASPWPAQDAVLNQE